MEVTGQLFSILERKNPHVWTIPPTATVFEALQLMAEHDIGALAVVADGTIAGIFSERDYARKIILHGKSSKDTHVSEVMTHPAITVSPTQPIGECMRLMTTTRTRHVLVVVEGRLTGMISIGDLVNWTISAQQEALGQLSSYIVGSYPA
jgi:CBS domain-containing protein